MAKRYDDFIKNINELMAGESMPVESNRRDIIAELDRLSDNPLELYLRWFRFGKLIYMDNSFHLDLFTSLLQDHGEIGLMTSLVISKQFDSEYMGYTPVYFGKAKYNGNNVYLIVYPCTMSGEEVNFQYLDNECGIATFILNMDKPNLNSIVPAKFSWDKDGFILQAVLS